MFDLPHRCERAIYDWLGPKKSQGIRLAVTDMWKPFRPLPARRLPLIAPNYPHKNPMKPN
jgi:hypothetical protein